MRIALFHTTLPEAGRKLGGVEVAVHRLGNALAHSGDVVTVYSLSSCPAGAEYRHKQLFGGSSWLRRNPLGRLLIVPALLNFASFGDAEVVHLHGDDWFYFWRKKPTVRTLHGSALREAQSAQSWPRRLMQFILYPLERLSAGLCTQSLAVGSDAARIYGAGRVVDNGVDTSVFFPGPKSPTPLVLYVGTWRGRKRGEFLFRLFTTQVLPQLPQAKLLMVSDYCPDHPSVIADPFPPDQELARHYREAWVFAYPSTYEGFGIAYLEALASGTAVLCSPNDGARYVLDNGAYGVIAEDAVFATKLVDLLSRPAERQALEERGIARAQQFSWDSVAAHHREIYTKVQRA